MARICIDIDGVIANLKQKGETYSDVDPIIGAKQKINALKDSGHYIILHTARHMKTCDGNVGKVVQRIGQQTLDWLAKHEIQYDEIYFGKPWADIYIDDNGFRFESWAQIADDGSNMPVNKEKLHEKTL